MLTALHGDMQTGISTVNHLRDVTPEKVPRVCRHSITSEQEFWQCLDTIEAECVAGWKPIICLGWFIRLGKRTSKLAWRDAIELLEVANEVRRI